MPVVARNWRCTSMKLFLRARNLQCFAPDHAHTRDNWLLARGGEGQSARSRWWAVSQQCQWYERLSNYFFDKSTWIRNEKSAGYVEIRPIDTKLLKSTRRNKPHYYHPPCVLQVYYHLLDYLPLDYCLLFYQPGKSVWHSIAIQRILSPTLSGNLNFYFFVSNIVSYFFGDDSKTNNILECLDPNCLIKVRLGISWTNADSQWNLVYKAFHRICSRSNETIGR